MDGSSSFPQLFSPVKIGNCVLKNRIAAGPTGRGECDPDGTPNEQVLCYYASLARGGVGLIIVEQALATFKYGSGIARILGINDERQMLWWRKLADVIHAESVAAVLQLGLGLGRWASPRFSPDIVSASGERGEVPAGSTPRGLRRREGVKGPAPRPLSTEEVEQLETLYVTAARRVKNAGFDGVEVHGAHGYLLAQFLSPGTNKRQDRYGGSFENRLALAGNLVARTRQAVGDDFVVGFRISGDEHTEGGYNLEDAKAMIPALVGAGLDYVHLSSGSSSALKWMMPPKDGMIGPEAAEVKKVASVPVICPNVHRPATGEKLIAGGKADVVSLSRSLLADPEWPNKARDGRVREITPCIFCNTCTDYLSRSLGVRCSQNPRVGWERFLPGYQPAPAPVPSVKDPI